uniref:Tensin 4 n=1 Tax=Athene cunicularia TaxID=194338 RepID=A0A663MQE4_ATHCN
MSQVIQNHVLRVGQTVCVSSQEESKSLHPGGYPGCSALPMKYAYYSTEGWAAPSAGGKGQQDPSSETPAAPYQLKEEGDTGTDLEAHVVSPTLDISIESLNQLILEIDPTFQPLPDTCSPQSLATEPASKGNILLFPPADIKYIEMTPGRAPCPELLQGSPSPSATPFSRSPQGNGFLPQKGLLRGNYSTSGSVVFSSPPGPASPRSGTLSCAASPPCSKASECIAVPAQGRADSISYGPSALGTSPGFGNFLKPVHMVRAQQRSSWVSLLSTSPGSDTSYILGSSTHSLHTDDGDAHAAACCSAECPSPASPLGSPCPPSPRSHSGGAFGLSPPQPRAGCSAKVNTSLSQKGQASSCPPSILNSAADIPVLLVNGCLEQGDVSSGPPSRFGPGVGRGAVEPNSCPERGSKQSPAGLDAVRSLAGPLRAGQPTMKFVMDTSKYWFKPSITRDQAIQLLKDKEPGTFVVRDSTSYRGSFGLAMKVPVSPSGSQTGTGAHSERTAGEGRGGDPRAGSSSSPGHGAVLWALALPCQSPGSLFCVARSDGAGSRSRGASAVPGVCNVLYLSSVHMETLTGAPAIQKAVSSTFELETLPTPTLVHFRVTEQGVTLTDVQRRVFFRRHYPLAAIRFCGTDPQNRKIFGFVAKSQTDSENLCHLFAEYDTVQSASPVIDLLCTLLPGP